METIEIDLTTPVPKHSIVVSQSVMATSGQDHNGSTPNHFAHNQVIQPAIRSIIKTKKTNLGGQHNAYHGFFYVEEHPPPPPPHAYELQQGYHPQTHQMVAYPQDINCYGPIYSEPPPIMSAISCDEQNNVPVPLPRSFEMVPYVETQQQQPVQQQQEEVVESVAASRRRRRSKTKSQMEALPIISGAEQQENREQPVGAESVIVVQGPPPTEEQVISQVMTKARQNRSKSCHERSDSMKKYTKRRLAPDEDLITVVTDDHHFINSTGSGMTGQSAENAPKPKPRKNLSRNGRSGSASLGNILAVNPDQFLINDNGDVFVDKADRQTLPRLPRRHQQQDLPSPQAEIYYVEQQQHILARDPPPKPTPRKNNNENSSSYSNRHPLSLSTETILFNDDKYDPNPIVPNRAPDVPDIWLPMRSVKA